MKISTYSLAGKSIKSRLLHLFLGGGYDDNPAGRGLRLFVFTCIYFLIIIYALWYQFVPDHKHLSVFMMVLSAMIGFIAIISILLLDTKNEFNKVYGVRSLYRIVIFNIIMFFIGLYNFDRLTKPVEYSIVEKQVYRIDRQITTNPNCPIIGVFYEEDINVSICMSRNDIADYIEGLKNGKRVILKMKKNKII